MPAPRASFFFPEISDLVSTARPASRSRGAADESPDLRTRSDRWHLTRPRHPRPSLRARSLATTRTPQPVIARLRQPHQKKRKTDLFDLQKSLERSMVNSPSEESPKRRLATRSLIHLSRDQTGRARELAGDARDEKRVTYLLHQYKDNADRVIPEFLTVPIAEWYAASSPNLRPFKVFPGFPSS